MPPNPLASLRRFLRPPPQPERCALCSLELPEEHPHLVEPGKRRMICACQACAILFSHREAGQYRRVPRRAELLSDFRLTDLAWEGLGVPIGLAFFHHSSPLGRVVAVYPSPAGAIESLLSLEAWEGVVDDNPILRTLEPDVEALLVNRVNGACDYYLVGIDECYKLVGLLRLHWRGFSGGDKLWEEAGRFFAGLQERSRQLGDVAHA